MRSKLFCLVLSGVLLASSAWPSPVLADEPAPEARVRAQLRFAEGEAAYKRGDYRAAAEAFDAAYKEIHHHVPLINAARAWARAGENARAANAYDRFLDEAPPQDPDRATATTWLKEQTSQLGQLHITGDGFEQIKVDGAPVDRARIFVAPGVHEIEGKKGDHAARRSEKVGAGEEVHVRLEAAPAVVAPVPEPPRRTPASPATATDPAREPSPPGRGGLSPVVIAIGGGLAAVAGVLTIVSGADTISYKHGTFAGNENPDTLGEGVYRERRTNVLLGTTIGLFALTGAAAIFLVDWGGNGALVGSAGPGGVSVTGAF